MTSIGNCEVVIGGREIASATHVIVLPDRPTPSENRAAVELQFHLEKITGHRLPVVTGAAPTDRSWLVVGRSPALDALGVQVDYTALGVEGVRLKTVGTHLLLTGNQRGVLYAVYLFLDEYLGCRWFTADCATWPTSGRIVVRDLDRLHIPVLEYRATDYPGSRPPEFAVRNRLNGTQIEATEEWGGKVSYRGFVHTFESLVPAAEHFAAHPEYFSEINGVRVAENAQLCLTSPGALQVAIATVRRWIRESPEATIVSVSQNDRGNYCTCPACNALAEAEGAQSGPLLHFVNAIARDIATDYPHIIIDTLAYTYTRQPPRRVRPEPNVAVRLCTIECEFNRPLDTAPFNRSFVADIRGWQAICKRLHIWDYVINYAHCLQPFPNLRVLQPNIRFFIGNGVTGIYEQANSFSSGGEFAELRAWLVARLLWNPDLAVEPAIDEFLAAYYGPAAAPIREYLDDIHQRAAAAADFHMRIYVPPYSPFQTATAVARYRVLFDRAEAFVADDAIRLRRVQAARLALLYTEISRHIRPLYRLTAETLAPVAAAGELPALVQQFTAICRREGVSHVAETGGELDRWLDGLTTSMPALPVVRITGGGLTAVVVPGLGGRLVSLCHGDRELLQVVAYEEGINPLDGGYKEFSESNYGSPGGSDPFTVVRRDERSVELQAMLSNGLRFERQYAIDRHRPVLRIHSTLTNAGQEPTTACLRVHPCFRLDDAATAMLRLGPPGVPAQDLRAGLGRPAELWLRGAARPAGEWTLMQTPDGWALTSRFKPDQVSVCYLSWHSADQRANLELWSTPRTLGAGESLTLEHEYEMSNA